MFSLDPTKTVYKQQVREQKRIYNRSIREIDRTLNKIRREMKKAENEMKREARKGQMSTVKIISKEFMIMKNKEKLLIKFKASIRSFSSMLDTLPLPQKIQSTLESLSKQYFSKIKAILPLLNLEVIHIYSYRININIFVFAIAMVCKA